MVTTDKKREVEVLVVQCGGADPVPEKNVEANIKLVYEAVKDRKPHFIVFTELSNTQYFCGYNDPKWFGLAEPIDGPSVTRMREVAKDIGCYILFTFYEKGFVKGEYFNSLAVIDPRGELVPGTLPDGRQVKCYRKCHIPDQYSYSPGLNERYYFKGGPGLPVFDTDHGRIGSLICYERSFPEGWRVLALHGAEIIFVPTAAWGNYRADSWGFELRTTAVQNGVFVVAPNKGGSEITEGERIFYGHSIVYSPMGELLAEGPKQQGPATIWATLDMSEVERHGRRYTFFRDRRPELYSSLADVSRNGY
ncbi:MULTISPECIES: carbon-nitrogen hydrolase family protein [Limibacillus]|jgi:N-carbamoylputrescine amidase|uniref:N-carbamoylputrescine amidase n=1 Tax=Limibacillus halophilus TaxID=1579333 RepID=A0A839SN54_9PROT|nr:nitrilase-related carbon-nitrogen hydrolase [Limibacillus halophilus]MBB3064251.1 N-carbamoylputrescine amidase [Limibacillus halophilus]